MLLPSDAPGEPTFRPRWAGFEASNPHTFRPLYTQQPSCTRLLQGNQTKRAADSCLFEKLHRWVWDAVCSAQQMRAFLAIFCFTQNGILYTSAASVASLLGVYQAPESLLAASNPDGTPAFKTVHADSCTSPACFPTEDIPPLALGDQDRSLILHGSFQKWVAHLPRACRWEYGPTTLSLSPSPSLAAWSRSQQPKKWSSSAPTFSPFTCPPYPPNCVIRRPRAVGGKGSARSMASLQPAP
jgi:hypothetical protein